MKDLKPIIKSLIREKTGPLLLLLQIAVTYTVLVNAVFMLLQKHEEIHVSSGLAESELFWFQMSLHGEPEEMKASLFRDLEAIKSLDTVKNAVTLNSIPFSEWGVGHEIRLDRNAEGFITKAAFYTGSHDAAETLGLKLIAGQGFELSDERRLFDFGLDTPSGIVISKALAEQLYPLDWQQVLGKTVYLNEDAQVVKGIVEHLIGPWSYWENSNYNVLFSTATVSSEVFLMIRIQGESAKQSMQDVMRIVMQEPNRTVDHLEMLTESRANAYRSQVAAYSTLKAVVIGLALITMLGVFGQARFAILKRRKQIGTRRALGASRIAIVRYYLLENAVINLIGIALGMVLAIVANNLLISHFNLLPVPSIYLFYGSVIIFGAGTLAVVQPAIRAASISPSEATRSV
ncbi:FtsX-like permease family protein [Pseudoalteromonas luteoviolacea]|uniref:ABC transporter permease n=1 Tax=Pseudoalteromonas luteoviolacea TaxID=43657 RepID=UPI001B36A0C6|nr:FtsX-like permease family protein [Pseudoalteromonas luteoviolacea]MBQ4812215.1 FtsX-like permease family protein [Pseudoalteromonas luteoviolacea]